MRKTFLATSAAVLAMIAAPASAQLLGGGGLTGGLGGGLTGSLGGGLGGSLGGTMGSIESTTGGTLSGRADSSGSHHVDRKSGSVSAERSVGTAAGGTLDQTLSSPARSISGSASGNGSANADARGNAQLIGTDAIRDGVASTRATVSGAASSAMNVAGEGATRAANTGNGAAASGNGAAQGSAGGTGSLAGSNLAAAGSAASSLTGAFSIEPGMDIQSAKGKTIGTVRDVETDAHGKVQSLLVEVDNRTATLPASNFSANGNALVSAMGSGEIKKEAKKQAADSPNGSGQKNTADES